MRTLVFKGLYTALCAILLGACSAQQKREFIYCSEGDPSSFNPQTASDGTTFDASSQVLYNRLLAFKEGTAEVGPSLAKSWSISTDGKEFLFTLRDDVFFHKTKYFTPQRKMNADDVVFSFQKMMDFNHPFHSVSASTYVYFDSMGMRDSLLSVEKVSDYKVLFRLKNPDATFLSNLAMDFTSVLSKEYADELLKTSKVENFDLKPVGTGPFVFHKYTKGKKIIYKAHPKYFGGAPSISSLQFLITPSSAKRLEHLKSGKCHFVKNFASLKTFEMGKHVLKSVKAPGLNVSYIGINLRKDKFKNPKLRLAMSKALNRRSYIASVYNGNAVLAHSPLPPGNWAYDETLTPFSYDLSEARKLIKESGVDLPFSVKLWTLPVSRPYNPNGKLMGEMIKNDLMQIGVDVELMTYDWPTYLDKMRGGEHELVQYGWSSDNGDPDNFLNLLLSCQGALGGSNVSGYCDEEYDELVLGAKRNFIKSKRKELYKKAVLKFQEDMPFIPIAHSNLFRVMRPEVENYQMRRMGTESFYGVRLNTWK